MALNLAWSRAAVSAALLGFVLMQACGGELDDPPLPGGTGSTSGRSAVGKPVGVGGTGGDSGGNTGATGGTGAIGGNAGETGTPDEFAPIVEVTSPEALSDPNDEGVIVAEELDVVCEARQSPAAGAFPVEPSTVTIELLDADGEVVDTVEADPTGDPDEFSARVLLAGVPDNGRIGFRCNASDGQLPPLTGSDTVFSLIDHGPLIEVDSPEEDAAFAQMGGLLFDFSVTPAPLADGDDGARIDEVLLDVNGVSIELPDPDDGRYRFSVALTDRTLFAETPDGEIPVTLRARNRRDPEPVERLLSYPIVIDGDGPTITIESPKNHDVEGGFVTLHFTVEDELSEIDEASVTVNVGQVEHRFDTTESLWERDGPKFSYSFDSTMLMGLDSAQVTLNVHASDEVGNHSEGRSVEIYFDNVPPIVDLDPGNVRLFREVTDGIECSNSFDPVGPAPPNDRAVVPRLRLFRALIWERTNYLTGQSILFHSGTDEDSAQIYLERDPAVPLLVDTNSDGVCDDLDTEGDTRTEFIDLMPIAPAGFAPFGSDDALVVPVAPDQCTFLGERPPVTLCDDDSDLSIAISQLNITSKPPAIYAVALDTGPTCAGNDWQFGGEDEGWLCFAARAKDNLGNIGISRPLRLCYDNPDDGLPPPDCVTDDTPPSCTDGCSLPPSFEPAFLEQ
jgi:hypothetical protein